MKTGVLNVTGAHCASCAYTIEHLGRKIRGIKEVRVKTAEQKIVVGYDGEEKVLDELVKIVQKIGYDAQVVEGDSAE